MSNKERPLTIWQKFKRKAAQHLTPAMEKSDKAASHLDLLAQDLLPSSSSRISASAGDIFTEARVTGVGSLERGEQAHVQVSERSTYGLGAEAADAAIRRTSELLVTNNLKFSQPEWLTRGLNQNAMYSLEVHVKEGRDLVAKDLTGTSDPYIKFKMGGKLHYKTRVIYKTLNPHWDEKFKLTIGNIFQPVELKVSDRDFGFRDDPMGQAFIDVSQLNLNSKEEIKLYLTEGNSPVYMGYVVLDVALRPMSEQEKEELALEAKQSELDHSKKKLAPEWSGVVRIVLVSGKHFVVLDDGEQCSPFVKVRLGNEKYKSKVAKKSVSPKWLEKFELHLFEKQTKLLEVSVFDGAAGASHFMGRATFDLSELEPERTHNVDLKLEDGAGTLKCLVTLCHFQTSVVLSSANEKDQRQIASQFALWHSFRNMKTVGWLRVKVIKARNLPAADFGGKSDPFCVLEVVNLYARTNTQYKTLNPEWNRSFVFEVGDIHEMLDVTVFDEDQKTCEFLGKVSTPLLQIENGERKWYPLKDRKLRSSAERGEILLELDFIFNPLKAVVRTFNPREEKYITPDPKFKVSVLRHNIDRLQRILHGLTTFGAFIQSCIQWTSGPRSLAVFLASLLLVWNFELYLLPLTIIIVLVYNWTMIKFAKVAQGGAAPGGAGGTNTAEEDLEEDDDKKESEDNVVLKSRLQVIQEICLMVQEYMDYVASLLERVKNLFLFRVPWLSWLAVILLALGCLVLYLVPPRLLLLAFLINKFTKKFRQPPGYVDNTEILDFLSRVYSDDEIAQYTGSACTLAESLPASNESPKRSSTRKK